MINLVRNENMKIYQRIRTWIMVGLLAAIVIAGSLIMWYTEAEKAATMWGPIINLTDLTVVITLFVIIVAGDILAGEFSSGTIKLLLIRPATRLKIMLAKYISLILFVLFLLIVLFLSSVLVNGIIYGFEGWDQPYKNVNADGTFEQQNAPAHVWQKYFLNSVSTLMYMTMAFMISSVFRSSAMAIGISLFSMFAGLGLTMLFQRYEWSKYLLFANIDLSQHIAGVPFREEMTMGFSVAVLIGYFILFHLLSWIVFTRRDVAV